MFYGGDRSKYNPVERAEAICGFKANRIANQEMANRFNIALYGNKNLSQTN